MPIAIVAILLLTASSSAVPARQVTKPAADLWVKAIRSPAAPARFAAGARFNVTITVENRGTAAAPGSGTAGYMVDLSFGSGTAGFPPAPHIVPAPYRFVEGMLLRGGRISRTVDLAPGATQDYSAEVVLPKDLKPGRYWLGITVDPFDRVREPQPHPRGEHDNATNVEIEVLPTPAR